MKVGDIVMCKKILFHNNKMLFIPNNKYEICCISKLWITLLDEIELCGKDGYAFIKSKNCVTNDENFYDYFYTSEELRVKKLNTIL